MSLSSEVVILPEAPRSELPAWVTTFAVVVRALSRWGVLKKVEDIHVARKSGYSLIDGFGLLLAYFCCNEKREGGLRGFCGYLQRESLGEKLASLLGRQRMPSSASVSRLLEAMKKPQVEQVLE